jgi:iron complex outermembrane receptor protein
MPPRSSITTTQMCVNTLFLFGFALGVPRAYGEGAGFDEEVLVVAPTPSGGGLGIKAERLPFISQGADSDALERAQSLDLSDYLNSNLGSVSINGAQNNPLQPDVNYRGFSASPLLGLPMGISVFQNGVRINEPLGDGVNWDLLPESAIHSLNLVGGANPLFGLNTLGGALSIKMKDGFNYTGHAAEISGGSWGRVSGNIESGGNNESLGYYANLQYFDESGWRDLSDSDSLNFFTAFSWRGLRGEANVNFQYADTELTGNGPAPAGLLSRDRAQVFTAPDITENRLHALTFDSTHDVSDELSLSGNAFYRRIETAAFNGDASGFSTCALSNGTFLLDELDEDGLDALGLDPQSLCTSNSLGAADPDDLERRLNSFAGSPGDFNIEDLTPSLTGTGVLEDEAINNRSTRTQQAYGADAQAVITRALFSRENYFVAGFSFYRGEADFDAVVELARLDPLTRSTAGRGVGTFVQDLAANVQTRSDTWSFYFLDNFVATDKLTLTVGGRYNDTHTRLRDRSGERRELNGDHDFRRFNPMLGATYAALEAVNVYANYSESSRAPTPIELACNEGVFEVAREFAIEDGEDPDDIEFECRLPNAFLADPPLKQVVANSVEGGVRGVLAEVDYRIGYFHTANNDDIIFQSTGRNTGLFANVDQTKREGLEVAFAGTFARLEWFTAYSYIDATFGSRFAVLSPNHPAADSDGEVLVDEGNRIPGIPRHQLKLGGDMAFDFGFNLGFEILYSSDQVLRGDEANLLNTVDGYATVSLRMKYSVTANAELFARVTNLFDTDYENFGLIGEDPTDVLPTLTNPSGIFLGAGAPRGAWAGLRVRF